MQLTHERIVPGFSAPLTEVEHWQRYRFAAPLATGCRVGDIACGSGYGSRFLLDSGASSVTGVDLSPDAVAYASQTYGTEQLQFAVGNAEDLQGIPDQSFDLVTSFETIEHLQNVGAYLKEIHRVLRPGGRYIVSTPERSFDVFYPITRRPRNQFHVFEYSRKQFEEAVGRHFEITDRLGQTFVSPLWVWWPVQTALKLLARVFRRGAFPRWKQQIYDPVEEDRMAVLPAASSPGMIAKYWVLSCIRR